MIPIAFKSFIILPLMLIFFGLFIEITRGPNSNRLKFFISTKMEGNQTGIFLSVKFGQNPALSFQAPQ